MKTHQQIGEKFGKTQSGSQPVPDHMSWKNATLPQIAGSGADGMPSAMRTARDWRPGEAAKRGYEKAVEDWWWL